MQKLLTLIAILTVTNLFCQTIDTIPIKHKKEKYYLTKTCYDFIEWDEIKLQDTSIENKINSVIRKTVMSFKLNEDNAEARCHNTMDYNTTCMIVYAKNDLISFYLTASTYFQGAAHGWTEFKTLNFNAKTGNQIHFHDFIYADKISTIDSLILYENEVQNYNEYINQMADLEFTISDQGIWIVLRSTFGPSDFLLTHERISPFVKKNELLQKLYK